MCNQISWTHPGNHISRGFRPLGPSNSNLSVNSSVYANFENNFDRGESVASVGLMDGKLYSRVYSKIVSPGDLITI